MQTDGYILSLTSKWNKNINFFIVAKHTAARLECLADMRLICCKGIKNTWLLCYYYLVFVKHQQCVRHFSKPEGQQKML